MKRTAIIAALFAAAFLAVAGWLGWLAWKRATVLVFIFTQQVTPDGAFANSYLASDGARWTSTRAEFSLQITGRYGPMIGRTTGEQEIHAVPGSSDYLSMSGFMNPAVIFRRESIPPVAPETLKVEAVRYVGEPGGHDLFHLCSCRQQWSNIPRHAI